MKVRPYADNDLSIIYEIYALSALDEFSTDKDQFKLIPLEKDHKKREQLLESDIYVIEDNTGEIKGYGAVYNTRIRALFIHPDSRRLGYGRALLEYMLSQISGAASLFVVSSNSQAIALYEKYGFTKVDEIQATYSGITFIANKMST